MEVRTFKMQRIFVLEALEIAAISGLWWKFAVLVGSKTAPFRGSAS